MWTRVERSPVQASLAGYEDVFCVHRIPTAIRGGIWRALAEPPRWHSAAKSLRPDISVLELVRAVKSLDACAVADSYSTLDLTSAGFRTLFEATWLFRPPSPSPVRPWPDGWRILSNEDELAVWNCAHDTSGGLIPALLQHLRFTFLARRHGGGLVAGAVLHLTPEAVELSNTWALGGLAEDIPSVLQCAQALFQEHALVGYAHGDELDILTAAGFRPCGPMTVWAR